MNWNIGELSVIYVYTQIGEDVMAGTVSGRFLVYFHTLYAVNYVCKYL
jgi:hypothetical protein